MKNYKKRLIVFMIVLGMLSFASQSIVAAEETQSTANSDIREEITYSSKKVDFQLRLGYDSDIEEQEDFWRVITSTEELQTFIDGDLASYCEKMKFVNEKQYEKLQQHLQTLDEAYFAENVYVVTVNSNFTDLADLYVRSLENIGESEEDELFGKCLKITYGNGGPTEPMIPGVVYGGTTVSRADLDGKELVKVEVSTAPYEEPTVFWEGNFQYEQSSYEWYGSYCIKILGYQKTWTDSTTVIEIPSELKGMPVVIIGEGVFEGVVADKIVVPDTVREIQEGAFAVCQVNEIVLPEKLEVIGDKAFYCISGTESITVPRRVESIGNNAFGFSADNELIIRGYEGSLAESYADVYGHPFVSIGKEINSICLNEYLHYAGDVITRHGETDKDGLSAEDALIILQYVVGLSDDVDVRSADANQDGTVNAEDALCVLECVVELKDEHVLCPYAYEIYQSCLGNLKRVWGEEEPQDDVPEDFWRVIESKEELQEFINGDLEKYFDKLTRRWGNNPSAPRHVQYLDDEFFEENVYVVTIIGYSGVLTTYTIDCLEDVAAGGDNSSAGKRLKIVLGSLDEDVAYPEQAMEAVYGGMVIPRSDLDGVDIVDLELR